MLELPRTLSHQATIPVTCYSLEMSLLLRKSAPGCTGVRHSLEGFLFSQPACSTRNYSFLQLNMPWDHNLFIYFCFSRQRRGEITDLSCSGTLLFLPWRCILEPSIPISYRSLARGLGIQDPPLVLLRCLENIHL